MTRRDQGEERLDIETNEANVHLFRVFNVATRVNRKVIYWSGKRGVISEVTKGKLKCEGSKKITIEYGTGQEPLKKEIPEPYCIDKPHETWDDRCPRIPIIRVVETDVSGEETVIFIDPVSATATFGDVWIRNFIPCSN